MDKKEVFAHFSRIIDSLIDNSLYFDTYFQRPFYLDDDIYGRDHDELPSNISLCGGATRVCLIDDDYDWVVKFDIDEDANGSVCAREERIYEASKSYALDRYFAEVEYLGEYTKSYSFYDISAIEQWCNFYGYDPESFDKEFAENEDHFGRLHTITVRIPLFGYRKADSCERMSMMVNNDDETVKSAKRIASPLRSRNVAIAAAFINEYGWDEYKVFSEFGMNWDINDIHFGNIGSIDGHLCLIDYGGYHSCDGSSYSSPWRFSNSDI